MFNYLIGQTIGKTLTSLANSFVNGQILTHYLGPNKISAKTGNDQELLICKKLHHDIYHGPKYRHTKIKKLPMGVLHSFSIKNVFYDKMDLRGFYFHVTICLRILTQTILVGVLL